MIEIVPEQPADDGAIEALLDEAFGPDRRAKRSYRYRDGIERVWPLCLVARSAAGGAASAVVGTIRYWPIAIGAPKTPALLLGPIAVATAYRAYGLGAALIRLSLGIAASSGQRVVILVGDEPYYRRFRFSPAGLFGIAMAEEDPARVLVRFIGAPPDGFEGGAILRADAASVIEAA
jgi:predicted N-acetyltransferase YhbS